MRAGLYLRLLPSDSADATRELSTEAADIPRPTDCNQAIGLVPLAHLDVGGGKRPACHQAPADDAMRNGRRQPQEVASEVDCDPRPRAHMLDGVPTRRVDARRQRAAVEKGSWLLTPECGVEWIEPQYDRIVTELDGHEPDGGVER